MNRPCWQLPPEQAYAEQEYAIDRVEDAPWVSSVSPAGPAWYPPASRTAQWFGDTYPGENMGGVDKIVWHTTETGGWPGYASGASAPTLTYDPRKHEWRQHFLLYRSARALRDPSFTLVRENRDRVVQVELVACSDHGFAQRHGYLDVRNMDDQALKELGAFARFMHDEYGVPYTAAPLLDYPASYGNSSVRMTGPQFDAFRGHCGHENVSGNSHGDPDSMNLAAVLNHAKGTTPIPTPAPTDWFDMATKEDLKAAVREVLAEDRLTLDWNGEKVSIYEALSYIHFNGADGSFTKTPIPDTSVRVGDRGRATHASVVEEALDVLLPDPTAPPTP